MNNVPKRVCQVFVAASLVTVTATAVSNDVASAFGDPDRRTLAEHVSISGAGNPDTLDFILTIDGGQEVPPVDTPAVGSGTATLDLTTNEFSWEITFTEDQLTSPETAAHFHGPAPYCVNAGIEIDLPLGSPKIGSAILSDQQVDDVLDGLWYINIHTENHPPGEIRGQVLPPPLPDALPPVDESDIQIALEPLVTGLVAPTSGTTAPGDPDRLFVTDQAGLLLAVELDTSDTSIFLDVTDRLVDLGIAGPGTFDERGLLGLAFHPDYTDNGLLYTYTSEPVEGEADFSTMPPGVAANHHAVILEWEVPDPGDPDSVVDPDSARELLRIDQPQFNHNGGALAFGPDGLLYVALGDGGSADDQGIGHPCIGNGQDASNPLGAILRIDPQGDNAANGQYGIPADNPFVGEPGFVDEIFAYGLRNPWRMSFDSMTGEFYVADVGQNDIEEINIVQAGDNLGWNHMEGTFFFIKNGDESGYITDRPIQVPDDLVDPIAEYHNPTDGIAIIGGFVYRGSAIPELEGRYVFGDWSMSFVNPSGRLFHLTDDNEILAFNLDNNEPFEAFVQGFGEDANGELYVMTNTTGTPFGETGVVYSIVGVEAEGCSLGFWKNHSGEGPQPNLWVGHSPDDIFDDVFDTTSFGDATLLDVISSPSGGPKAATNNPHVNNLGKQAVAALLNAASSVDYPLTETQVIDSVADALQSGEKEIINALKDELDEFNNLGCPSFNDADLTQTAAVGVGDLLLLLGNWGHCADPNACPADITGSGSVDVHDLVILLNNWGPQPVVWTAH